jgi:hypothetical protein
LELPFCYVSTYIQLLYDVRLQYFKDFFCAVIAVNVQIDRLGKIKAEDSHDRLCIDYVSTGYEIEITVVLGNVVNKTLYLVNGIQ